MVSKPCANYALRYSPLDNRAVTDVTFSVLMKQKNVFTNSFEIGITFYPNQILYSKYPDQFLCETFLKVEFSPSGKIYD